jgi:hypothetical protein
VVLISVTCKTRIIIIIIIIIIIPGNHDVRELQKTAILGNAHILQKVLTLKHKRANAGTRERGTINNNDSIAATIYSLGTWFVSGICVDTLLKGENGDDDNDDDNNNNNNNNTVKIKLDYGL